MNKNDKLQRLKALTESVKATKAKLASAKKLEEAMRPTNIGLLLEAELEQAEVILAAKDFVSKLQKMAEDLAKMQAESIPLGDNMRTVIGPEIATDFEGSVNDAIQSALASIREAKDTINASVTRAEGGEIVEPAIGNDMGMDDAGADIDLDLGGEDMGDEFGGAEASAGPSDAPLGRGMKESYKAIGAKLLVKESLESLVGWLMEDVAATMAPTAMPKFAGQIAAKGAQDAERLAGWIGSRKYGKGLSAQLNSPMPDMDSDLLDEGKSYKVSDDEDEETVKDKKKASKDKGDKAAAKRAVEEGKSYKVSDDEDEETVKDKKKGAVAKGDKAKAKRSIEEAVRMIIDRNIAQTGKGFAARAIAEAQSRFPMVEGIENVAEAFEAAYGMTPQAYSIKKARIVAEAPLNPADKKSAGAAISGVAGEMASDKNLGNKPAQTALSKMDPKARAAAQKVIANAKQSGKDVKKVSDLVDATNQELEENINAANWPVNSMGQYKGEPFSTDYNKLKPNKTSSDYGTQADTPKNKAGEESSETPWDGANKEPSESPKTSDGATTSTKPAAPSKDGAKSEKKED